MCRGCYCGCDESEAWWEARLARSVNPKPRWLTPTGPVELTRIEFPIIPAPKRTAVTTSKTKPTRKPRATKRYSWRCPECATGRHTTCTGEAQAVDQGLCWCPCPTAWAVTDALNSAQEAKWKARIDARRRPVELTRIEFPTAPRQGGLKGSRARA